MAGWPAWAIRLHTPATGLLYRTSRKVLRLTTTQNYTNLFARGLGISSAPKRQILTTSMAPAITAVSDDSAYSFDMLMPGSVIAKQTRRATQNTMQVFFDTISAQPLKKRSIHS